MSEEKDCLPRLSQAYHVPLTMFLGHEEKEDVRIILRDFYKDYHSPIPYIKIRN